MATVHIAIGPGSKPDIRQGMVFTIDQKEFQDRCNDPKSTLGILKTLIDQLIKFGWVTIGTGHGTIWLMYWVE